VAVNRRVKVSVMLSTLSNLIKKVDKMIIGHAFADRQFTRFVLLINLFFTTHCLKIASFFHSSFFLNVVAHDLFSVFI